MSIWDASNPMPNWNNIPRSNYDDRPWYERGMGRVSDVDYGDEFPPPFYDERSWKEEVNRESEKFFEGRDFSGGYIPGRNQEAIDTMREFYDKEDRRRQGIPEIFGDQKYALIGIGILVVGLIIYNR